MQPRLSPAERVARRQQVADLLRQVNEEVAALPRPVMRELGTVLAQAQRELARDLRAWLARQDDMGARFTAQQMRAALVQMRSALAAVAQLEPGMSHALRRGGDTAGKLAAYHIRRELAFFSEIFEGTIRPLPFQVAGVLAHGEKMLVPRFRSSAMRYADQVGKDIRRELAVGVVRGETIEQLTTRLARHGGPKGLVAVRGVAGEPGAVAIDVSEGLFKRYRWWAERLARTEVIHAYNVNADLALREVAKGDPELRKRWDAALDGRTCQECRELDHVVVKMDQAFPGGVDHPPAHPACFPPGTPILTSTGWRPIERITVGTQVLSHRGRWRPVVGLSRSPFAGELVLVDGGGHLVAATPDHPFSTPSGWVAAKELDISGTAIRILADGPPGIAHDAPAQLQEHGTLHGVQLKLSPESMPLPAVDLHSDPLQGECKVDVVSRDGEIGDGRQSPRAQRSKQRDLQSGAEPPLPRSGLACKHGLAPFHATGRLIGGLRLRPDLVGCHRRIAPGVVLRDAAHDAGVVQDTIDGSPTLTMESPRKGNGGLAVKVQLADQGLQSDELSVHIVDVPLRRLASQTYSGPVYNFQVDEDESYIAGGFVVHNCRCAVVAWREDWSEAGTVKRADAEDPDAPPGRAEQPIAGPE